MNRRLALVAAALTVQGMLVGAAVAPQLSARTGAEYRLRVAPLDPIDPFRGAYVALDYPDLPLRPRGTEPGNESPPAGRVSVPLRVAGSTASGDAPVTTRPVDGPYLTCDGNGFALDCGIDSWFAPQAKARDLERHLDGAIATIRVDDHGNAALVDLTPAT